MWGGKRRGTTREKKGRQVETRESSGRIAEEEGGREERRQGGKKTREEFKQRGKERGRGRGEEEGGEKKKGRRREGEREEKRREGGKEEGWEEEEGGEKRREKGETTNHKPQTTNHKQQTTNHKQQTTKMENPGFDPGTFFCLRRRLRRAASKKPSRESAPQNSHPTGCMALSIAIEPVSSVCEVCCRCADSVAGPCSLLRRTARSYTTSTTPFNTTYLVKEK